MKAKHTLGPWRQEYPLVWSATGSKLLRITEYDCATIYDAKLIAAAPELLEALQDLLFLDNGKPEFGSARAAIAKATG